MWLCIDVRRVTFLIASCICSAPASAQRSFRVVVTSAAIGSLVGGVRARIMKRPVVRGFALGSLGGFLSGSGRQFVSATSRASWWSARAVNAAGNAVAELAVSDTFVVRLSTGPIDFAVAPRARRRVRARLNAVSTFSAISSLARARSRIVWRESFMTGTLTVMGPSADQRATAQPGLIQLPVDGYLRSADGARRQRLDVAHELVHVMQFDAIQQLIGTAVEHRVSRAARLPRGLDRWLTVGVTGPAILGVTAWVLPYHRNPFEIEAWAASTGGVPPRAP
jgi:hypothetical protein